MSDIQNDIEFIIKKCGTLTTNSTIYIYINKIENGLVFKRKYGYKPELQISETIKLSSSTKKVIEKE